MTITPGSTELLAAIPRVLDGVAVRVVDHDGQSTAVFGTPPAQIAGELRAELPDGAVVASYAAADAATRGLVTSLLEVVADRERLESDMESMMPRSTLLLEQLSIYSDTLPRLAAGDSTEIASGGVRACHRATEARRVVYLDYDAARGTCDVVADFQPHGAEAPEPIDATFAVEGFVAEVLAREDVQIRDVPREGRLGAPGSPEHVARSQVLGVPITYGQGDKRVVLGAMLLCDKLASYAGAEAPRFGNEEVQVAHSFAAMLGAVIGARKTAELGKELTMARAIQRQILPANAVELAGFDVAAEYRACGAVGGDYFDYVPLADGRQMVVIADVSGHNLASGMMMVSARAMLRTLASVRSEPAQVFDQLAASMYDDLVRTERFLTAAAIAVRPCERTVDYVSAGHNDLLVYRAATDAVETVASESTILGFVPDPGYVSRQLRLAPGDCLLLFTDGITEATDANDEMFGDDRLAALLAQLAPGRSARAIVDGVLHELDRFRCGREGLDDVTIVAIRCVDDGGCR
ncbi:MAG: serine/threonine-protein phosphatase [Planctomycetes bacterium]|nr:serine/threonine-protein phosphatase [Planctomycetota bacterium]